MPTPEPVLLVTEARAQLTTLIQRVNAGESFLVGAHGRPQAALVPPSRVVEDGASGLKAAAHGIAYEAAHRDQDAERRWMPSPQFTNFLAWCWRHGAPHVAETALISLLEEVRATRPDITPNDVLRALEMTITDDSFGNAGFHPLAQEALRWAREQWGPQS